MSVVEKVILIMESILDLKKSVNKRITVKLGKNVTARKYNIVIVPCCTIL